VKVRYTLPALADLDAVLGYTETQSPQGARRVRLRLEALIELLATGPRSARELTIPRSAV